MEQLTVELAERSYPIFIDAGLLEKPEFFAPYIKGKQILIVTNETIAKYSYLETLKTTLANYQIDAVILPDGEKYKDLERLNQIFSKLLEAPHGRDTTLIALGGGVIGDTAGFAAACYQRGIDFIQIPTTLLAQVDSSVGGKTAVNHPLGKNMIGAFYQPQAVIIDINCLKTLPQKELIAGMAEVIKYGIIEDGEFFSWLEQNVKQLLALDFKLIAQAIARCCQIKADVVAADEKENGKRALLNLGHTYGHAIEAAQGYGNWLHGEAVAAGMIMAAKTALIEKLINQTEFDRMLNLIQTAGLPIKPPSNMKFEDFMQLMMRDKKVQQGTLRLVLPTSVGTADIYSNVSSKTIAEVINS